MKWVQGQSDVTSLLYILTTKYDIATIYSFNVKTFGKEEMPRLMLQNGIKFLTNNSVKQEEYGFNLDDDGRKSNPECITKFYKIRGRIIGGCLECLKDLVGTKYDNTKKFINKYKDDGIIWYFDVFDMTNEDILRTMWQFKELGWFKYTKGIIFGRLYEEKSFTNTTLRDALNYSLKELNIPIIINADIGHTDPKITIVNGSIANVSKKDKFQIEMELK